MNAAAGLANRALDVQQIAVSETLAPQRPERALSLREMLGTARLAALVVLSALALGAGVWFWAGPERARDPLGSAALAERSASTGRGQMLVFVLVALLAVGAAAAALRAHSTDQDA